MIYTPEQIDFNCFFMATKTILGDLVIGCNPYTQKYFKIKDLYVALSYQAETNNLHIDMMAGKGGLELFEQVRLTGVKCGAKTITFVTSKNNSKVNKIAKFYKATILTEIPKFYPDGSVGIIYQISI